MAMIEFTMQGSHFDAAISMGTESQALVRGNDNARFVRTWSLAMIVRIRALLTDLQVYRDEYPR